MATNGTNGTTNGHAAAAVQESAGKGFDFGGGDLSALTKPPTFTDVDEERAYLKERLCAAMRIFAAEKFDHGVAGHLTVRDPGNPHNFWVNPFGLAWRIITVSDLILVNQQGKVIGGGKPGRQIVNLAGFQIHSAIHKARPDVNAICHSHSTYGKAYSTLGRELDLTTQDSCAFYNDCALLKDFGGVVITEGESNLIATTIGAKKAILLQNHGILTVGGTIDSAVGVYIMLEKQCEVILLADAAAGARGEKAVLIDEPQAKFTYEQTGTERASYFQASPYFQTIDFLQGDEYRK